jgi:hypothetical protein
MIGRTLVRYRIEAMLGRGRDGQLDRAVALVLPLARKSE